MRSAIIALLLLGIAAPALAQRPPERPIVVELFTSQGCSSCPPADALLTELATRPDILALAFHVTYWNNLGWRDPFSLDAATTRQRGYQRLLGAETIYTPQMIVDGRTDVIGSDRPAVRAALAAARRGPSVAIDVIRTPQGLQIAVGPGTGTARLLVIGYDGSHHTAVGRGENAGRQLTESNVVRSLTAAGTWQGQAMTVTAEAPAAERTAILLQAEDGRILGAAVLPRFAPGLSG
jgi:hypothetical protein